MKNFIVILFAFGFVNIGMSQITLNSCNALLENQDYTFNFKETDVTDRNVYETDPVDENSPCGGIGNCELQIAWNTTSSRWEIYADDGNGTFTNTYVLYYNTATATPNPPSLNLGTWVEETAVTGSECGLILSLTGDVQDQETLSIEDVVLENQISIYPNPVQNTLYINHLNLTLEHVTLYDVLGKLLADAKNLDVIDVSHYNPGLYFIRIQIENRELIKKVIIE
jgi:hypothetical protein